MPRRHLARRDEQAPKIPLASAIRAIGSRKFWVITVANLLVMTSYYLVFVITAAHVRETWHTSLSVTGLAVGVMIMGCLVGRFVSGNLVSLHGLSCRTFCERQPRLPAGLQKDPVDRTCPLSDAP